MQKTTTRTLSVDKPHAEAAVDRALLIEPTALKSDPFPGAIKMADRSDRGWHWCTMDDACRTCALMKAEPTPVWEVTAGPAPISTPEHWDVTLTREPVQIGKAIDKLNASLGLQRDNAMLREQNARMELIALRNESEELRKENDSLRRQLRAKAREERK